MTATETTGWRDESLSRRHREYGFDLPATDLDLVMVEYHHGKAMALVDYKLDSPRPTDPWPISRAKANYRAISDLGTRARVPVFVTLYPRSMEWFEADPLNDLAEAWVARRTRMSEFAWVTLLYQMKAMPVPREVAAILRR